MTITTALVILAIWLPLGLLPLLIIHPTTCKENQP